MEIGRKIYYEKTNGIVIWDKGEMEGEVEETTLVEDKIVMPVLALISDTQLGIKQLGFGELANEFMNSKGYRINPETEEVEFITAQ